MADDTTLEIATGAERAFQRKLRPREVAVRDGMVLHLCELANDANVASVVWPCAEFLVHQLAWDERLLGGLVPSEQRTWRGVRVVEIGSGTGVVGLSAALLGAHVTLTDHQASLALLQYNASTFAKVHERTEVRVAVFDWNDWAHTRELFDRQDVMIVCECLFDTAQMVRSPVVATIRKFLANDETEHQRRTVIVAFEERDVDIEDAVFDQLRDGTPKLVITRVAKSKPVAPSEGNSRDGAIHYNVYLIHSV
jgi:hypothetical protein